MRSSFVITVVASAVAVALAAAVPGASAANPQILHFAFSGTNADDPNKDDFCGTGMTVNVSFAGHANVWLAPNQPVASRNQSESNAVFTNPVNGATVIIHTAYQFTGTLISGDPNGLHILDWVFRGAAQVVRAGRGGVLSRDAGSLVVHATFDGDEFVSSEIVLDHGGHPAFNLFCDVMVPALGLS